MVRDDIFKKNISTAGKVIASIVVLLTSWLGFAVYYFYAKDPLQEWFRKKTERIRNEGGSARKPPSFF